MKILLYQWQAYGEKSLQKGLEEAEVEVVTYDRKIENHLLDEAFLQELVLKLVNEKISAVISFDFFPMVSMACKVAKVPYAAWIFGAPHYSLYCDIAAEEHNFIFCFDRIQAEKLKMAEAVHVYHLPLATDTEIFQEKIKKAKLKRTQISFVGNLYTDENYYFQQMQSLSPYVKGYLEGICEAQLQVYGADLITGMLPQKIMDELSNAVPFHMDANYSLSFSQFMVDVLQKKVTVMERHRLLKRISEQFELALYTHSDTSGLPKAKNGGYIHYYNEMPIVFAESDINLNITLRSILTGIPLRVLDVAACGGFLISNFQTEVAEWFQEGKEIVFFTCEEELVEKCDYYLKHDTERKKIAKQGYERVRQDFSYAERIKVILKTLEREIG